MSFRVRSCEFILIGCNHFWLNEKQPTSSCSLDFRELLSYQGRFFSTFTEKSWYIFVNQPGSFLTTGGRCGKVEGSSHSEAQRSNSGPRASWVIFLRDHLPAPCSWKKDLPEKPCSWPTHLGKWGLPLGLSSKIWGVWTTHSPQRSFGRRGGHDQDVHCLYRWRHNLHLKYLDDQLHRRSNQGGQDIGAFWGKYSICIYIYHLQKAWGLSESVFSHNHPLGWFKYPGWFWWLHGDPGIFSEISPSHSPIEFSPNVSFVVWKAIRQILHQFNRSVPSSKSRMFGHGPSENWV